MKMSYVKKTDGSEKFMDHFISKYRYSCKSWLVLENVFLSYYVKILLKSDCRNRVALNYAINRSYDDTTEILVRMSPKFAHCTLTLNLVTVSKFKDLISNYGYFRR